MPDADPPELIDQLRQWGAKLRLRKSGRLHTVDLSACETDIDDARLAALDQAQKLEELNLADTSVTDAGVERLTSHKTLKLLTLSGTKVSPDGVKRLRKRMIGCRILYLEPR
ncbi:MAG: hypothetical protein ACIALR_12515 [Blastopirellula sp. JB062]